MTTSKLSNVKTAFDVAGLVAELGDDARYYELHNTGRFGVGNGYWALFHHDVSPGRNPVAKTGKDGRGALERRASFRIGMRLVDIPSVDSCPDCHGDVAMKCARCNGKMTVRCWHCPPPCDCEHCPGHSCDECRDSRVMRCDACDGTGAFSCGHQSLRDIAPVVATGPSRINGHIWNAVLSRANDAEIEVSPGPSKFDSVVVRGEDWVAVLMPMVAGDSNPLAFVAVPAEVSK